jgi:hypothetical protein
VLTVLEDSVVGGCVMPLRADEIAQRIWSSPTRSQVGAIRRALDGLELAGLATWDQSQRAKLWQVRS